MPALGPVVLGAIAVFLLVLVSLLMQGKRQATSTHVLLVIKGLPRPGAGVEPAIISGTDNLWTQRWVSGLLLVESASDAGEVARSFERMTDAGTRAVASAAARQPATIAESATP